MNLKRTIATIQKIMTAQANKIDPITATLGYGSLTVARSGRSITIKDDAFRGRMGAFGTVTLADLQPIVKSNPTEIEIECGDGAERILKTDTGISVMAYDVPSEYRGLMDHNAKPEMATVPRDTIFSPMIAKIADTSATGGTFDSFRCEVSDKQAHVIATDSVRMIVTSSAAKGSIKINLPGWVALIAGLIKTSPVQIVKQGAGFEIATEDRNVVVCGLDDERSFPNWRSILPDGGDAMSATFKPEALAKTLDLLMPFSSDTDNTKIKKITMAVPDGRTYRQMEIKAPGLKEAQSVGCFASGFLMKPITFNPKYIVEFLTTIKLEAVARCQIWTASRPALFSTKNEDREIRYVLMPINL